MKTLAALIDRELQSGKWNHYAVYENDLMRVWPQDEPEREAQIAKFAKEHGFRLRFYRMGMCAIFDKETAKLKPLQSAKTPKQSARSKKQSIQGLSDNPF